MRRIWRESVRAGVVVLASASLALAPGLAAAQSQTGSGQQTGQAGTESAKNDAKSAKQGAGSVADQLHDSAKNFGEALLGGIKYAGRTVIGFFNGDKPKQ